MNRRTNGQTDRGTERWIDRKMDRRTNGQIEKRNERRTGRLRDGRTDGKIDNEDYRFKSLIFSFFFLLSIKLLSFHQKPANGSELIKPFRAVIYTL